MKNETFMKKRLLKLYRPTLFVAGILVGLSSCKKQKIEPLPEASQTGANTLGCKINGKNWVAQDSDEPFNRAYGVDGGYLANVSSYPTQNNVWILARQNDGSKLQIYLRDVGKPAVISLALIQEPFPMSWLHTIMVITPTNQVDT